MPHPLTASTASNVADIVKMAAQGLSQEKIAKALGISKKTVWRTLAQPDVATKVASLRAALRVVMTEGVQVVAPPALDWAKRLAEEQKDPKGFDAVMRGLHAAEKIASSASGENREPKGGATGAMVRVAILPGWGGPVSHSPVGVVNAKPVFPALPENL